MPKPTVLLLALLAAGCHLVGDGATVADCACILTVRDSGGDRVPMSGAESWFVCVESGDDADAAAAEVCESTWLETITDEDTLDTPLCMCECAVTTDGCTP